MQEKHLKWLFLGVAIIAAGIFYLIWSDLGVGPKGVQKIKLAVVESPQAIGENTYLRLRQEIAQEWVIFFGISPEDERQVEALKSFIAAAGNDGRAFSKVFCERELIEKKNDFPCDELKMNDASDSMTLKVVEDLSGLVKQSRTENSTPPYLVVLPQSFSTHLISGNPINTWDLSFKTRFMSITLGQMAVAADQMQWLSPPCLGSERDREGTMDLACTIRRLSRAAQRKSLPVDQLAYQLVQQGNKDYLGLLSIRKPNQQ